MRREQAAKVRARLINVLGAGHISPLGATEVGWTMTICRTCASSYRREKRAG
jgi:hypothetical protein